MKLDYVTTTTSCCPWTRISDPPWGCSYASPASRHSLS